MPASYPLDLCRRVQRQKNQLVEAHKKKWQPLDSSVEGCVYTLSLIHDEKVQATLFPGVSKEEQAEKMQAAEPKLIMDTLLTA
jgi:hypothetical protein